MLLQPSPFVHWQGRQDYGRVPGDSEPPRGVLATTEDFTGPTKDKTTICRDAAVDQIRKDKKYTDTQFDVYIDNGTTRTLKGCYLLVDN